MTLDCDIATLWVALDIGLWHWTLNCDIVGNNWQPQTEQPGQYLTPDATSNPTTLHWIVSEAPGAFNGGVRSVFLLSLARRSGKESCKVGCTTWADVCQCFLIKHCRCVFFVNPKNILAFNRNVLFDYIRCPFDDWNQVRIDFWRKTIFVFEGWEVDTGLGHWVEDPTMRLRCHKGEEVTKEYKYKYDNKTNTNTGEGVSDIKLQFQFI